jgi:hypothetical protein
MILHVPRNFLSSQTGSAEAEKAQVQGYRNYRDLRELWSYLLPDQGVAMVEAAPVSPRVSCP